MAKSSAPSPTRLRAIATGQRGEAVARRLACERGWQPWLGNVPVAGCEADLVCFREVGGQRRGLLLEVKATRRANPELAARLGPRQKRRLWRMAEALCVQHDLASIEIALVLVTLEPNREHAMWLDLEAF